VDEIIHMYADDICRPLFSQWLVDSDDPPLEWRERIQPVIDYNDNVLIVEMSSEYAGYLQDETWSWLQARV
jgi:hypothetical protein